MAGSRACHKLVSCNNVRVPATAHETHQRNLPLKRAHRGQGSSQRMGLPPARRPSAPRVGLSHQCHVPATLHTRLGQHPAVPPETGLQFSQLGRASLRWGTLSSFTQWFPEPLGRADTRQLGKAQPGYFQAWEQWSQVETGTDSLTQTTQPAQQAGLRQVAH